MVKTLAIKLNKSKPKHTKNKKNKSRNGAVWYLFEQEVYFEMLSNPKIYTTFP